MSSGITWNVNNVRDTSQDRFGMDGSMRYVASGGTTEINIKIENMSPAEAKNITDLITRLQKARGYGIGGEEMIYETTPKPIGPVVEMSVQGVVTTINGSPLVASGSYEIDSRTTYADWYRTAKDFFIRKINTSEFATLPPSCTVCERGHRVYATGLRCPVCVEISAAPIRDYVNDIASPANEATDLTMIEGLPVEESWRFPVWSETEFTAWYRTQLGEFIQDTSGALQKLLYGQSVCRNGHIIKAGSWCATCDDNTRRNNYPREEKQREWAEQQLRASKERAAERTYRASATRDLILDD